MANRNVTRKISKLRQTAIQTSSASRRFQASDDASWDWAGQMKRDIGATGEHSIEDLQEQAAEEAAARDIEEQRLLFVGIPEEERVEAIRRLREAERNRKQNLREKEENARSEGRDDEVIEYSEYRQEDAQAKRTNQALHGAINQQAAARYIPRGGPTYQFGAEQFEPSLEDQMVARGGIEAGGGRVTKYEDRPEEEYEREFAPEQVVWRGADRQKAQDLIQKRNELRSLERRIKENQGRSLREQKVEVDPATGKRRIVGGMPEVARRVRAQREQVEAELSNLRPSAVVGGRVVNPRRTEDIARTAFRQATAVPDPGDPSKPLLLPPPGKSREDYTPREIAQEKAYRDAEAAYVHYTTMSFHAPTHALRQDAAQKAARLSNQISQNVQAVHSKRQDAARRSLIRSQLPRAARETQRLNIARAEQIRAEKARGARLVYTPEQIDRLNQSRYDRLLRGSAGGVTSSIEEINLARKRAEERMRKPTPRFTTAAPPPISDPRLSGRTVEDLYDTYKHEEQAPRLKWEKDRLKARFSGDSFDERKPALFEPILGRKIETGERIGGQLRFLRDQTQGRVKGFVEGSEILGINEERQPVPLTDRQGYKALIGTKPNLEYVYQTTNPKEYSDEALSRQATLDNMLSRHAQLRDRRAKAVKNNASANTLREIDKQIGQTRDAIGRQTERVEEVRGPVTKVLPATDQATTFYEGKRDRFGALYPGERDELVAPVTTRRAQRSTLAFGTADRQPKDIRQRQTPEDVDEVRYIPSPGAKGETRTVKDPTGEKKLRYLVAPNTPGTAIPGTEREIEVSAAEYAQYEADIRAAARSGGIAPIKVRTEPIDRKIMYKYMDPKDLEMKQTRGRDVVTLRVPKVGPFGERLVPIQFGERPESRWDQLLGRPLREYSQTKKLDAARTIAQPPKGVNPQLAERYGKHLQGKYSIKDKSEAQILAGAAAAAGYYATKDRFRHGHLPNLGNKAINAIPGSDKYNVAFAVNQAFIRPSLEKTANLWLGIKHPLSSQSGDVFGGLGIESWKYRQENINKQKFAERYIKRQTQQLKKIQATADFVERNKARRGPVGAFTRWRMEPLSRSAGYRLGEKEGLLANIARTGRDATDTGELSYYRFKTGQTEHISLDPRAHRAATELAGQYNLTKRRLQSDPLAPVHIGPGFTRRALTSPGMERNILYGTAAVGAAAGAAYLYHRHQENKKPPEERRSVYEKVLPPAFDTPRIFPHARVTSTVKFGNTPLAQNLGFAGKELPTQFGFSLESKTLGGPGSKFPSRPSARGYEPGLPLVGRASVRGTKGGSRSRGLIYDTPIVRGNRVQGDVANRRNIRRQTHELTVAGHKVPGHLNVGPLKKIEMHNRNPNRYSATDRENIIWAHADTPLEQHVQAFYRGAGGENARRINETWEDRAELERIRRQKGRTSPAGRAFQREALRQRQRVIPAGEGTR